MKVCKNCMAQLPDEEVFVHSVKFHMNKAHKMILIWKEQTYYLMRLSLSPPTNSSRCY